jgi:hypothetical protein
MNPRQHPSCSGLPALALCAGKLKAETGLPERTTEDAESGTAIHAWLAETPMRPLRGDEVEVAETCCRETTALLERVRPGNGWKIERELRLWHPGSLAFSGQADFIASTDEQAVIIDYKTGRNETTVAADNLQLAGLAVLLWGNRAVAPITTAIIAPRQNPSVTITTYGPMDLLAARARILEVIVAALAPDAKRVPGPDQCKYCRAAGTDRCPETQGEVKSLALQPTTPSALMDPAVLGILLDRCTLVETVIDRIRATAREMITAGVEVPGWRLKAGAERETITDPQAVYARCASLGVTVEAFLGTVTVGKGKLEKAVKEASGANGKALDALIGELLRDATETKQCAASLCRERI